MEHTGFTVLSEALVQRLAEADSVVGFRPDGLFARIICLLNTIRLADVLGKEPRYLWEEIDLRGTVPHGYDDGWRAVLRDDRIRDVPPMPNGAHPEEANFRTSLPAVLPGEDIGQVRAELGRIARSLVLADGRTVDEACGGDPFAWALHARQGDAAQLRYMITKYFPASGWLQILDRLLAEDPSGVAFLASDGARLLQEARRRHGDRVLTAREAVAEQPGKLAADFHEALALARGRRLIAPRQSAFSMFASLVSGVPVEPPEEVLGISDIVEEIMTVALTSYENDLGAALLHIDAAGVDAGPVAPQRRALLEAGALLRGRPGGAGYKDPDAPPRHPATVGVAAPGKGAGSVGQRDVLGVLALIAPQAPQVGSVRLGGDADGGYVLPDDLDGIAGAISIGVGGDVSFDRALADRGIPVLLVDHTVDDLPAPHPLFTLDRRAWALHTDAGTVSLADLVEQLDGLTGRPGADLLLKFDAEGAEWTSMPVAQPRLLRRFRVIVGELHGLASIGGRARNTAVQRRLVALTKDHQVTHLHANNAGRVAWVEGVPLVSAVEVSLLRRDRGTFTPVAARIPGPLDRPNLPHRADLVWTPFGADVPTTSGTGDREGPGERSGPPRRLRWWR